MGNPANSSSAPNAANPLLTVRYLTVTKSRRRILQDVAFDVRGGEVLGLIGPNGAGKTTLFEAIAGLIPCDGAELRFHGGSQQQQMFFMPDGLRPWPDETVRWTLRLFARMFRVNARAVDELSRQLQLDPLLRQRVSSLSKGETKRLNIALGLLTPHPLLLLDEPFDGLDLRQTRQLADLLRSVSAGGRTLLLSIHQLTDAARVCDRFVLLTGGRVVAQGTLADLHAQSGHPAESLEEIFLALT